MTRAEPLLIPIDRARDELGVGNTTLWRLMKEGAIESVSIGRKRLVVFASLKGYVSKLRQSHTQSHTSTRFGASAGERQKIGIRQKSRNLKQLVDDDE